MAKEKSSHVVFHILRLNGERNLKTTPIHYPHLNWTLGRTKAEDQPDESSNIEFTKGRLELEADDWRVEWMRAYNDGGEITVNGIKKRIKGDRSMYIITEENPDDKVKIQEKLVDRIVEQRVVDRSFVEVLTIDQLEKLCISNGIDISKHPNTTEGLIAALDSNGNISK